MTGLSSAAAASLAGLLTVAGLRYVFGARPTPGAVAPVRPDRPMRVTLEILQPIVLPDGFRPLVPGERLDFEIGSRDPIVVCRHLPASLQPVLVEAAELGAARMRTEHVSPARARAALQGLRVVS